MGNNAYPVITMNKTTQEKITAWDRLTMWWDDMGGVVAYRNEDCKPNNRPMILTGVSLVVFNIGWGVFTVSYFLNS